MPFRPGLVCYRLVSRLLPRDFRAYAGDELELAAAACVARERSRLGRLGVTLAAVRIALDTISHGIALRFGSTHHAIGLHQPPRRGFFEGLMDNLKNDLLYALRGLARQPGFTLIAVLTLTLGIGANTAIFSVVNGVLLRPLAYPNADQLEFVTTKFPSIGFDQFWVSPPEVVELAAHNTSFSSLGAYASDSVTINADGAAPQRVNAGLVTGSLMSTLGVPPFAGRALNDDDTRPGAERVAVLSWALWQRDFGGDPKLLGTQITANAVPRTVVGIMPRGFDVHDGKFEIWLPLTLNPADLPNQRGSHYLYVIARRKANVSSAAARADLATMQTHWADFVAAGTRHVFDNSKPINHQLRIDPLKADVIGTVGTALLVLQGAVLLVLIIACANLANLLLARAESRQREFAVRTALGAARSRLLTQFITEGTVLSALGAAAGTGLAWLSINALVTTNPDAIPRSAEVALDWRVLVFTVGLTAVTGVLFGLAPLANLSRKLSSTLRDGARTTGTRAQKAVRSTLVIAEVTLAVILVAGAGLLVRSLTNLMSVDAGFNRAKLVTFQLVLPNASYGQAQQRSDFYARLQERLQAIGGVESVAAMDGLPPNRPVIANDTDFEHIPNNRPPLAQPVENVDYWQTVTLDYIKTMGIPIVKGRDFDAQDRGGAPVALVNETLVKRFFTDVDGRDAIGARFKAGFGDKLDYFTIVGVAKDVKQNGVDAPVGAELYLLSEQLPRVQAFAGVPNDMNIVLRTAQPLSALSRPILQAVRDLDATLPVVKLRTMDDVFGDSVSRPRFLTMLLSIFGGLALALAAIGTYGVLSFLVQQQSQEIGIRLALGAARGNVLALILRKGLTLAAIGIVIGVAGALALGRLMQTLLFQVSPADPVTLVVVAALIAAVAVVACLVPALRATRIDPLVTLRQTN
jgi:putative ABC transport system permease protein